MRMQFVVRFDYVAIVPWVRRMDGGIRAIAGPDTLLLRTPLPLRGENLTTVAEFTVAEGQRIPFELTWYPSHQPMPDALDAEEAIRHTQAWWEEWSTRCTYEGPWRDAVVRSL